MHKPFDFEAAKAGEPVDISLGGEWESAHFIGETKGNNFVLQINPIESECALRITSKDNLRMAAKKVTVRYRVAVTLQNGWPETVLARTNEQVSNIEADRMFVMWIHTEWQEVEVPQ